MKETLIICNHCGGNACSEISNEQITIWNCFGCGFTSNSTLTEEKVIEIEKTLPELYKDLKFIDISGYVWYPLSVMMDDRAMIFAEGTTIENWKWSAVKAKDGKTDMSSKVEFKKQDFLEALDYIGYFNMVNKEN